MVRATEELQALQEERKVPENLSSSNYCCITCVHCLSVYQTPSFQKVDPQTAEVIDQFLLKLKACASGDSPFTFILDDPAGNSFIENP